MAKKKKIEKVYEEIDGVEYEVKNPSRKNLVKVYQDMVTNAQAEYVAKNRMMEKKRKYAESLLKNVERAPFVLGWLHWPEVPEEDKGLKKGSKKRDSKKKKRDSKPAKSTISKKKQDSSKKKQDSTKGLKKGSKKKK